MTHVQDTRNKYIEIIFCRFGEKHIEKLTFAFHWINAFCKNISAGIFPKHRKKKPFTKFPFGNSKIRIACKNGDILFLYKKKTFYLIYKKVSVFIV